MNKKNILIVLYFIIFYVLFLVIGLMFIAQPLIALEKKIIFLIFGNFFNYLSFSFVPYCSGVVSGGTYLAIIGSLKANGVVKVKGKLIILHTLLLLMANFGRVLLVLTMEKISFKVAEITHVVSWFIMGVIIIYLVLNYLKK